MKTGIELIERNIEAIRAIAQEYDVARLEVFGSATSDEFDPSRSDIDFLIEYLPNTDLGPWIKRYFELQERLEALLGHPVDLVMAGALRNKYFIRSVNETRQLLYAA
jgi:predicted nucleotidyltransferase